VLTIIQNDPDVPPGILVAVLDAENVPSRIVRPGSGEALPELADVSALVVLGGKMGVGDVQAFPFLEDVKRLMAEAAEQGIPQLGICLGGQLLANALGGSVKSKHRQERGVREIALTALGCNDPLFHDIPYEFVTFHWHDDSFDIPEQAVLLATNSHCPNQAFRYDANAYAVQFHPEVNRHIVASWTAEDEAACLSKEFDQVETAHRQVGEAIFVNFLRISRLTS